MPLRKGKIYRVFLRWKENYLKWQTRFKEGHYKQRLVNVGKKKKSINLEQYVISERGIWPGIKYWTIACQLG